MKKQTRVVYDVIIPASGLSKRFGKDKLKLKLKNEMVIKHSLTYFIEDKDCQKILLVINKKEFSFYKNLFCLVNKVVVVVGGQTRFESVRNGTKYVSNENVMIHDGARPFLTYDTLMMVKEALKNGSELGTLAIKTRDSVLKVNKEIQYENREEIYLVQTPQFFKKSILLQSYEKYLIKKSFKEYHDELSLVLDFHKNLKPTLVQGDPKNFKITYPDDIIEFE